MNPILLYQRGLLKTLDPLVAAFQTASGATDVSVTDEIIKYVRGIGKIDNFRLYPSNSATNAGSGSIVYGVGGLSAVNGTLTNGASWGVDGVVHDGTDDYIDVPIVGAKDYTELSWGINLAPDAASSPDPTSGAAFLGQGNINPNRFSYIGWGTGSLPGEILTIALQEGAAANRKGNTTFTWSAGEHFVMSANQKTVTMSANGATIANNLTTGSATDYTPSQHTAATDGFHVGKVQLLPSGAISPFDGKVSAFYFCDTSLTDSERHAIDDLIATY